MCFTTLLDTFVVYLKLFDVSVRTAILVRNPLSLHSQVAQPGAELLEETDTLLRVRLPSLAGIDGLAEEVTFNFLPSAHVQRP